METLGGQLDAPPTVVSWGPNRLDVFGHIAGTMMPWQWRWDGATWIGPIPLPLAAPGGNQGQPNLPPEGFGAVSLGVNRLDVFAAGGGNTPWWWHWNGAAWDNAKPLVAGANLPAEAISSVSSGPNCLDVFAAGANGNTPWWWHHDGATWFPPWQLPILPGSSLPAERVSAVSPKPNRLDVFAPSGNRRLLHWWNEAANGPQLWPGNWQVKDLGGNLSEGVAVTSWGVNRLDVFAVSRDPGSPLLHWWWDGGEFAGPENLGGSLASATVSAIATAPNRLEVFGVSGDGRLVRWRWDGEHWTGPIEGGENLAGGDVSAVASGPGRVHVFARGQNNSLQHWPSGPLSGWSNEPWNAYAQDHPIASIGHCHPGRLDELVAIVKDAERAGRKVRAVGNGWSFSDIAVTSDYIVETKFLNGVLNNVVGASPVVLNDRGTSLSLLHVEAGRTIADLNKLLERRRQSLRTMGGNSLQTLAGAVSTCVHGADFDRGPLPDCVRAIHLVGPGGIQHWIEPADAITNKAALTAALGLDPANVHYDDDWFNSALVSVGSMGIIYSMIIEVEPLLDLEDECRWLEWPEMRAKLADQSLFLPNLSLPIRPRVPVPQPRGVQVAVNQFRKANGQHQCYLTTRADWPPTAPFVGSGNSIGSIITKLKDIVLAASNVIFGVTAALNTPALETSLAPGKKRGYAHTILAAAEIPPLPVNALELAFDATNNAYLGFMDEALQIFDTQYANGKALGGYVSMRFVGASRAYLAPQYRFARTCMIEFVGLRGLITTKPILDLLEDAGRRHGAIQHWGMFSPAKMTASDVARAFPRLDRWRRIRWLLTSGGSVHTFDNDFTNRCGLSNSPFEYGVFDASYYLAQYADLQAAFGPQNLAAASDHWLGYGVKEGRRSSPAFDVAFYLGNHPDLVAAFGPKNYSAAIDHWIAYGVREGRKSSPTFDVKYYLAHNPDLVTAFGPQNHVAAIDHWLTYGIKEGRLGSA